MLVDNFVLHVCRSWLSMVADDMGEEMFEHILLSSLIQYDSVSFLDDSFDGSREVSSWPYRLLVQV